MMNLDFFVLVGAGAGMGRGRGRSSGLGQGVVLLYYVITVLHLQVTDKSVVRLEIFQEYDFDDENKMIFLTCLLDSDNLTP